VSERIFNLLELELPQRDEEGHDFRRRFLGEAVGAERTGFAVYEPAPGERAWPYHYELSVEEWLCPNDRPVTVWERRLLSVRPRV
jgi:uncharacterized cupin superfamily protein